MRKPFFFFFFLCGAHDVFRGLDRWNLTTDEQLHGFANNRLLRLSSHQMTTCIDVKFWGVLNSCTYGMRTSFMCTKYCNTVPFILN